MGAGDAQRHNVHGDKGSTENEKWLFAYYSLPRV